MSAAFLPKPWHFWTKATDRHYGPRHEGHESADGNVPTEHHVADSTVDLSLDHLVINAPTFTPTWNAPFYAWRREHGRG